MSYTAKIADFGTSVYVPEDRDHLSTVVKGTFGYLDPEYYSRQEITEKSDVYSFGVVLVKLLTSQKAIDANRPRENINLASGLFVHLDQIVDGEIINEGNFETVQKVSNLAEICLRDHGDGRPLMKEVVMELEGVMSTIAKHPAGGEKVNFFRSPKATNYLPGLPSNAYVVDVGGDDASSSSIKPYDDRR
ncbi:hypothetical protein C1H46_010573 [Malus baccata]|uniref:Protein kinase domain-containing protein n=1 Tax=Malus baccata TaxID=106549 RepID=A0A540MY95_MALBA|nr:hypothetical protein C1H46_010573 [Malus baccata]